jgi:hypothetical protein
MTKHTKPPAPPIDADAMARYVEEGWQLIPLHRPGDRTEHGGKMRPDGKRPLHKDWTNRTYDSAKVIESSAAEGRNVGVRLKASQLVIDVDPRHGGEAGFDVLCRDLGLDRNAWPHVVTGSGGSHFYLTKPEDVPVLDSVEQYPGVEFKSAGRQVVSAGSVHPDTMKHYEWSFDSPPLSDAKQAPANLLDMIRRPVRSTGAGGGEHAQAEAAQMLDALDPADFRDHDRWLQLMMAVHHATNGDAREEFLDWSAADPKYSDMREVNGRRWDSLHADAASTRVTYRTLHKFLIDAGQQGAIPRRTDAAEDFPDDLPADGPRMPEGPLQRLNRRYCVVTHGNRVRIMFLDRDHDDRGRGDQRRRFWTSLSVADFKARLRGKWIERPNKKDPTKSVKLPLADAWLDWDGHSNAIGVALDADDEPGAVIGRSTEDDAGYLNTWMGWGVEPSAGSWTRLRQMILEVLCAGNEEHADYLTKWMAWKAQNPGEPPEVTVALLGAKGSGKTTLGAEVLAPIFGSHGVVVVSSHQLAGKFSGHLADALFVFADEAVWGGDRETGSALKQLITDKRRLAESKGKDAVSVRNRVGLLMAANEGWSVPATSQDRRFFVLKVSGHRFVPQDAPADHENRRYWDALYAELNSGGRAALLHDLLHMDIGRWHPRTNVPKTEAQGEQVLEGLHNYELFYFEALRSGSAIEIGGLPQQAPDDLFGERADIDDFETAWSMELEVPAANVVEACVSWAARRNRFFKTSTKGLLEALKPYGIRKRKNRKGIRCWVFPALTDARRLFAKQLGHDPFDEQDDE